MNINIEFSPRQLEVLNAALGEIPYKHAAPVIAHINAEIQKSFEDAADARDMPSGATTQPDQFSGD